MKSLKDILDEQQAARQPHDDPLVERLIAELIRMAETVCVLRDRQDTIERLVGEGKMPDRDAIVAFDIDARLQSERLQRHREMFEQLFERLAHTD